MPPKQESSQNNASKLHKGRMREEKKEGEWKKMYTSIKNNKKIYMRDIKISAQGWTQFNSKGLG